MQRPWLKTVAAVVVAALFTGAAVRAESPFVGNWKLIDVSSGNEGALVLFQIEEKDGKADAKVLASPLLGKGVSISNVKVDEKAIHCDVKFQGGIFHASGFVPKADAKDKAVRGSINFNNRIILAMFKKTDDKEMSATDAKSDTAEGTTLQTALKNEDLKEQQAALKELFDKHADTPAAYIAGQYVLEHYAKEGAKDEELQATADKFIQIGASYGPDVERNSLLICARTLAIGDKVPPAAIEYARRLEKALTKEDSPETTVKVYKLLAMLLRRTGKVEEVKALEERINKIEEPLDAAFEKGAVPFKVEAFKGRKADSKRVAVVELFTGAYCPPCVAADVAFDAALETYKPKDVILLQYHLHIPAPDRLTNADSEARQKYYGGRFGTPTTFLNGKVVEHEVMYRGEKVMVGLGGSKAGSQESYDILCGKINEALETEATAALQLKVERKGDKLDIVGEVSNLKKPGEDVKLRFLLIEEVAAYPGGNGQRVHHNVVRALPGGADGFELKEETAKQNVLVNLADLKKSLDEYLITYNRTKSMFRDDEYPLNLKKLKVVALIQNDKGKEILQAIQMDVPEAK